MKKTMKTLTVALLVLAMLSGALAMTAAAAEVASGTSGDVSWTLTDDGTLTVSGEGAIGNDQSWLEHMDSITSIVIEEGITTIGNYAFYECAGFESVTLPASLTTIGNYAFTNCSDLKSVTIPASVTKIGNSVFYQCTSLATVNYLGASEPPTVGSYVFVGCSSTTVNVPVDYEGDTFAGLSVSKTLCDHAGHTQTGCTACGATDGSIHSFVSGTCSVCGAACTHDGTYDSATGKCLTCGVQAAASLTTADATPVVTYYATFEEAFTLAQEIDGCTVTILCDGELKKVVPIKNGSFIVDLNGKTITDLFKLSGGSATVKGNGTVKEELGVYYSQSTLIIEGGAYELITVVAGNLTVRGGTFDRINLSKNYHDSLAEILPEDYYLYGENGKIINAGAVVGNNVYYYVENVTVKKGADLSTDAVITVNSTVYNGDVQTPNGSHVTVTVGGVVLEHNVDYTISVYPDDDFINVGTYTITIYGEGNYTGSVEKTFTIEKATLTEADFTVENLTPTFNFGPQEVAVTLPAGLEQQYVTIGYMHSGAPLLGAPTDAGTYKVLVMVSGSPNHEDATVEYELVIAPAAATVELLDLDAEFFYTGQKHEPKLVATVNGGIPFEPTEFGGTVTYTGNIMVGTATATLGGNFTGSVNFEIQKAIPTVTVSAPLDKVMPGYVMNITAVTDALEGTSFTILPGEGYTVDGMKITIDEGVVIGSAITVKVASTATANYQAAEGELVLTIGVPTVDTAELEAKLAELEQKLAELETTHGADVTDLRGEIETLRQLIADLDGTYATDQELADAILAVTNTLTDLTDRVATLETTYATKAELEQAIADLKKAIAEGDAANAEALEAAVSKLEKALADAVAALEKADADNKAALEAMIADTKAALETALADAVAKLEKADADNKAALEKMIDQLEAALRAVTDALDARVTQNEEDIAQLRSALEQAIEDLKKAIAEGDEANAKALAEAVEMLTKALEDAVSKLEEADEKNRAELEALIAEAKATLEMAIARLRNELYVVRAELLTIMGEHDAVLDGKITELAAALEAAIAASQAADEALGVRIDETVAALNAAIAEAKAVLNAAIEQVAADLESARQLLNLSIANGDKALHDRIDDLTAALNAAVAAADAADEALRTELNARIDDAVSTLNAAIAQVQKNLTDTKEELTAKDDQLHKLVIVAIVIASVGVAGGAALTIFIIVDKRKK